MITNLQPHCMFACSQQFFTTQNTQADKHRTNEDQCTKASIQGKVPTSKSCQTKTSQKREGLVYMVSLFRPHLLHYLCIYSPRPPAEPSLAVGVKTPFAIRKYEYRLYGMYTMHQSVIQQDNKGRKRNTPEYKSCTRGFLPFPCASPVQSIPNPFRIQS